MTGPEERKMDRGKKKGEEALVFFQTPVHTSCWLFLELTVFHDFSAQRFLSLGS